MKEILVVGIFFSIFLSSLLLAKRDLTFSVVVNIFLLLSVGLFLYSSLLFSVKGNDRMIVFSIPLLLIYGPLVYLLVVSLIDQTRTFQIKDLFHFVPAIIFFLSLLFFEDLFFLFMIDSADDIMAYNFPEIIFLFFLVNAIYSFSAYSFILDNSLETSDNDSIISTWTKYIVLCFFFCSLMVLVYLIMQSFGLEGFNNHIYSILGMFMLLAEILCSIMAIKDVGYCCKEIDPFVKTVDNQKDDLIIQVAQTNEEEVRTSSKNMYEKSGLKKEYAELKHNELKLMMDTKKPHLRPQLNLKDLSEELKMSPHHLSQLINQYENKNFRDFINSYKIREFISRLMEDGAENKSIKELYVKSGFRSKTIFYDVFKKQIGMSPAEFISTFKGDCTKTEDS